MFLSRLAFTKESLQDVYIHSFTYFRSKLRGIRAPRDITVKEE